MLQAIRDRAQGWIAWVIVGLISVPFALWGIQSYFGFGSEAVVATVNGTDISERDLSQRVHRTRAELRERLGAAYDPDAFSDQLLREAIREDIIGEVLLVELSERLRLRPADDEIRLQILGEPAFQRDGRFDRDTYNRLLQLQGMNAPMFEEQIRRQLAGRQLTRSVAASEFLTRAEVEQFQRLDGQQRFFETVRFPAAMQAPADTLTEEAIRAYYERHLTRFQLPEQVRVEYLVLDVDSLAARPGLLQEIDAEEVRRLYDSEQARFQTPERRTVRHLLLRLPAEAEEARVQEVRQELLDLRARLLAGEAFADLAREHSQDPGSAAQGGDLGTFERGLMDPAFDQAAFTLAAATLSEPVRTRFGYHLIEVTAIEPERIQPYEEVREQLQKELARQAAEALYYDFGERLATLIYEQPEQLDGAAQELGLEIQQSDWFGRSGGEGVFAEPRVIAAAFSDDVLLGGQNSDLLEPARDRLQAIVLRRLEHRPVTAQPLDEVEEQIRDALGRERSRAAALAAAQETIERLREGERWQDLVEGLSQASYPGVTRNDPEAPRAVLALAFDLPLPKPGLPTFGAATLPGEEDAVLVRLDRVEDGTVSEDADAPLPIEAQILAMELGQSIFASLVGDIERRAKIKRLTLSTTRLD